MIVNPGDTFGVLVVLRILPPESRALRNRVEVRCMECRKVFVTRKDCLRKNPNRKCEHTPEARAKRFAKEVESREPFVFVRLPSGEIEKRRRRRSA